MFNQLHRFGTDTFLRFNPFDFVASIFYYPDCLPNRVFEWLLVAASCIAIGAIDPIGGLMAASCYMIGFIVRQDCSTCSAVQGIGICIATVATVLGKFGFISAFMVALGYVFVFGLWLVLVWLIAKSD